MSNDEERYYWVIDFAKSTITKQAVKGFETMVCMTYDLVCASPLMDKLNELIDKDAVRLIKITTEELWLAEK